MRFNPPWLWFTNPFNHPKKVKRPSGLMLGEKDCGSTLSFIKIGKEGATHEVLIGTTCYGKGCIPEGGHKPQTIIEQEGDK
jgi:hypothetical protein